MSRPHGFSWVEKPHLAAMARPEEVDELVWVRQQGIDVLLSLTEDPPSRDWIEESGLLLFHVPMIDMEAPTEDQLDRCLSAIQKANTSNMGVAVHCGAGLGRTGVVLACYFVTRGLTGQNAIARVRRVRPGSIETEEQAEAVLRYARKAKQEG